MYHLLIGIIKPPGLPRRVNRRLLKIDKRGRAEKNGEGTTMKILLILVVIGAVVLPGLAAPSQSPEAKTFLVVTFDVEDYITPASEGIDDIPKWLAEIMSEEGVTGTFFVIGEKARSLEARGRRDVIEAMARHDIGSHTNRGSIHPTVTERLERSAWETGVRLMAGEEAAGIADLGRIFGKNVRILARHGGSYGPQLVRALGTLRAGYQGSPARLPGRNVVWFCNALNFSAQYSGFDNYYYRNELFEPVLSKLEEEWPKIAGTGGVLALFAGHPCKIRTEQFWDLNFYGGRNTPPGEWKTPGLRPAASMETAKKNFRRLMRFLKGREDVEITTYSQLMKLYGRQKEILTKDELAGMALASLEKGSLVPHEYFSPAEAFAGLARAILDFEEKGALPPSFDVIHPLGPPEMPPRRPEISKVTRNDVRRLAAGANDRILRTGALPASLAVAGSRIGIGSLFALFSAAFLDMASGKTKPEYPVPPFEAYPKTNEEEIIREIEGYKSWPVHRPDLDMSGIIELTKLQLWTLKPAAIIVDSKR